ncbi:hypothetical protein Bca4012_054655 [Brassica carinata]
MKRRRKLGEKGFNRLYLKGGDENVTNGMDTTIKVLDTQYFKDLASRKGFLNSDQTSSVTRDKNFSRN